MDSKITLSFDKGTIEKAKAFAEANNISLSRLTEFLYAQIVTGDYKSLDELPVADWVNALAEGQAEYHTKSSRKSLKEEFYKSKK